MAVATARERRTEEESEGEHANAGHKPPLPDDSNGSPVADEAAEAAFLAEARERGEKVPVRNADDFESEADTRTLPPLDELVKRIPVETRELLDDLFRVRFTTVRRVRAKDLKS